MKNRSIYRCQSCGFTTPKWLGRCPDCGLWNVIVEEIVSEGARRGLRVVRERNQPHPISSVEIQEDKRVSTGIGEFDRVLGGGMVRGVSVLVGGDPGIGKSTLLLQAMGSHTRNGARVLYVSGEESIRQIRLRGERLGVLNDGLFVYSETSVEGILDTVRDIKPDAVVIDSIQTIYSETFESSPGSISQVREASLRLITSAKELEIPLFIVGHVTKDGTIAGPRVLEHMVDTVLYFEGDRGSPYRVLRAVKNRFGSVMEIGVFEMTEGGLREVLNPSEVFLQERPLGVSGSCVTSSLEGTRIILVEVQALVCPTIFGMPRRTVVGVDTNKVAIIVAVLEKKAGLQLANHDIFLKVAGGIRIDEPAIDLGILASVASNFLDRPVDPKAVIFGEVGLAGEVRAVTQAEPRVREAEKLGFSRCILPKDNLRGLKLSTSLNLTGVSTVREAMDVFF